tara:strand:- start:9 stop:410 length:402 start_codon:yes stop_codon:yes gene_type:complete
MNEILKKNFFSVLLIVILSLFIFSLARADLNDNTKKKAWNCVGIYMANYFLPSGEKFEYGMKEKSMASVKVWKEYAIEAGIKESDWDKGVNKAVDKHYGSKYSGKSTDQCHSFLEATIPNGKDRVKKVAQTLY